MELLLGSGLNLKFKSEVVYLTNDCEKTVLITIKVNVKNSDLNFIGELNKIKFVNI